MLENSAIDAPGSAPSPNGRGSGAARDWAVVKSLLVLAAAGLIVLGPGLEGRAHRNGAESTQGADEAVEWWRHHLVLDVRAGDAVGRIGEWRAGEVREVGFELADVGVGDADEERAWTSPVIAARLRCREVIVSWNIEAAEGSGAAVQVRLGAAPPANAKGPVEWTEYLDVGRAGSARWDAPRRMEWKAANGGRAARVDVDYVRSAQEWDLVQYRVVAAGKRVRIERMGVCVSAPAERGVEHGRDLRAPAVGVSVEIGVPFRTQRTSRPELSGRLCSPTSVGMVLAHFGAEPGGGTLEVAAGVHDPEFDLYGNWPRNVQAAFEWGVPGFVKRFNDWEEAEAVLRSGRPIVASIRVEGGELRGAPYRTTSGGHLIVLRGLTRAGDVLASDPAAGSAERGEVVYRREDLSRVWLGKGKGTAYVLWGGR